MTTQLTLCESTDQCTINSKLSNLANKELHKSVDILSVKVKGFSWNEIV